MYRKSNKKSLKAAADPGKGPRGPSPPLIFSPNWGVKGQKKFFFWDCIPPPSLIWRSGSATARFYICGNEEHGTKYVFWSTWVWRDLAPAMLSARRSINSLKLGSSCKKTHWHSKMDLRAQKRLELKLWISSSHILLAYSGGQKNLKQCEKPFQVIFT